MAAKDATIFDRVYVRRGLEDATKAVSKRDVCGMVVLLQKTDGSVTAARYGLLKIKKVAKVMEEQIELFKDAKEWNE